MPQVTAAKYPFVIGGRELYMSPLRDIDTDELTNWLRSHIVAAARKSIEGITDQDERDETIQAAVALASSMTFGDKRSMPWVKSHEGILRSFYQGVKRNHKRLSFKEFSALFKTADDVKEALRVWKELNLPQKHQSASDDDEDGEDVGGEELDQGEDVRGDSEEVQVHAEPDSEADAVPADEPGGS